MKLLFVSQHFPYPPYSDGSRLIEYNLLKNISKYNNIYFISFLIPGEEKYINQIKPFCDEFIAIPLKYSKLGRIKKYVHDIFSPKRFESVLMKNEINEAVKKFNPDVVHVDLPMMSQYWNCFDNIPKLINSVDAISLLAYKNIKDNKNLIKKLMWYLLYKQRKYIESKYFLNYNICTVVSGEDKGMLEKHSPNLKIEVIPNGVDIEYFDTDKVNIDVNYSDNQSVGIFGGMDFFPNEDASIFFISDIFPLVKKEYPQLKLYLVGRKPSERLSNFVKDKKDIIITGEVEDIREYYKKVSIAISPIRLGSGIKNTVLQAMAMSKAIVCTSQAVKAIDIINGKHVLVTDKNVEFAEKIINLIKNKELRKNIGDNARNLIVEKYSWEIHAKHFQKIYKDISLEKDVR